MCVLNADLDAAEAKVEQLKQALEQAIAERTPHDYGILKEEAQEMRNQRDEARAEVEQLKQALHDLRLENSGQAMLLERKRAEPSRLEIAAMAMQGMLAASGYEVSRLASGALHYTDALIAAAKEEK